MPSESESFGLAALEAMACKVPIITSNAGGLPELNIHGVTGYMDPMGEVDAMANHAIEILKDDQRLNWFKENALKRAKEFDLQLILPVYEQFYESMLATL